MILPDFEPYEPQPTCGEHRRKTSALCEMGVDHVGGHCGRDELGRWHSWAASPRGEQPS